MISPSTDLIRAVEQHPEASVGTMSSAGGVLVTDPWLTAANGSQSHIAGTPQRPCADVP